MKNTRKHSNSDGGSFLAALFGLGLLLYIIIRVLMELLKIAIQLISIAYQGVMTLIDILVSACVVFSGAVLIALAIAIIIDMLRPIFKRIADHKQKVEAVKNCAYPTITEFRGGSRHE